MTDFDALRQKAIEANTKQDRDRAAHASNLEFVRQQERAEAASAKAELQELADYIDANWLDLRHNFKTSYWQNAEGWQMGERYRSITFWRDPPARYRFEIDFPHLQIKESGHCQDLEHLGTVCLSYAERLGTRRPPPPTPRPIETLRDYPRAVALLGPGVMSLYLRLARTYHWLLRQF